MQSHDPRVRVEKLRRSHPAVGLAVLLTLALQAPRGLSSAGNSIVAPGGALESLSIIDPGPPPELAPVVGEVDKQIREVDKQRREIDQQIRCAEAVPDEKGLLGSLDDDGAPVPVRVHVIVDGKFSEQELRDLWSKVPAPYGDPNLEISANRPFQQANFSTKDALGLLNEAKELLGGRRPDGADVVFVVTDKDLEALGDPTPAGVADCIGGVRFPHRAFAVGEGKDRVSSEVFPAEDAPAKIAAHEIGHLLGGQHHYANCLEPPSSLEELPTCTLMFNAVNFVTLQFSTLNREVVRQHGLTYAR